MSTSIRCLTFAQFLSALEVFMETYGGRKRSLAVVTLATRFAMSSREPFKGTPRVDACPSNTVGRSEDDE